jgi:hypothetical protein
MKSHTPAESSDCPDADCLTLRASAFDAGDRAFGTLIDTARNQVPATKLTINLVRRGSALVAWTS